MKKAILIIISFALLIAIFASGFWLTRHFLESQKQNDLFTELAEEVETANETQGEKKSVITKFVQSLQSETKSAEKEESPTEVLRHDVHELRSASEDCLGWLSVPGTGIDYPVMWTPKDPAYYLHRNFYGEYSSYGTPFLDARCTKDSGNLIFYGHNMFDGSMFTPLLNYLDRDYLDRDYLESHKTVRLELDGELREYQVFAAFQTSAEETELYKFTELSGPPSRKAFLAEIEEESGKSPQISGWETCGFITLSTCDVSRQNGRIVVIGGTHVS